MSRAAAYHRGALMIITGRPEDTPMSTDPPAAPRRRPLRAIGLVGGPILVSVMLLAAVLYPTWHQADSAAPGACRSRPEATSAIRADPMFNEHPKSAKLGMAIDSFSCNTSAPSGPLGFVSNGALSRSLTTTLTGTQVRAFYAALADRSGWRADEDAAGLYSATKPAGACPLWFVVSARKDGYVLSFYYQPIGVPADDCEWASGSPMLIPLTD
jgi:hypothetical protein